MALALGVSALLLGGFLAVELGLRAYLAMRGWTANAYAPQLELFRPDPAIGCDLQPGFRLVNGAYRISINRLGLRGPDVEPKRPGRLRIATLGESSTFGYFVSDGEEWPRLLEQRLRAAGRDVEVLNAGVPGYALPHTTERFRRLIAPERPEVTLLYLGWNDLPSIVSDEPDSERFTRRPVAGFTERLAGRSVAWSLLRYRLMGGGMRLAPASLATTEPTRAGDRAFRRNLQGLLREIRAAGSSPIVVLQLSAARADAASELKPLLGSRPELIEPTVRLGQWLRTTLAEEAAALDVPVIDTASLPADRTMLRDYIHLTQAGEAALAELLAERLPATGAFAPSP